MTDVASTLDLDDQIQRVGIFLGGMRCGSTAILDYLKQHPEVCSHDKKDPHFFSSDENWLKGWDWYLKGWSHFDADRHKIAFESSTHYTKYPMYPKSANRMAQTCRDLRLIYGVRGPIARVESHLVHNSGKGYLDPRNPEQRARLLKQAIYVSNYELQMERYARYFPPEKILVIDLAELKSRPQECLKTVFDFLGVCVDWQIEPIPLRERRFRNETDDVRLTQEERTHVAEQLHDTTRRFETQYKVVIWDGPADCIDAATDR